jgi:hypothetical protein
MKKSLCNMIIGLASLGVMSVGAGCFGPAGGEVDIVDSQGYHHHGHYDNDHHWHGYYEDEHHGHHDDPDDWHR